MIPALPAFSLLMARNLASHGDGEKTGGWRFAVPAFYTVLGVAAFAAPFTKLSGSLDRIGITGIHWLSYGLLAIGVTLFFVKQRSTSRLVACTAVSSLVLCAVVFASDVPFFQRYDLHGISGAIKQKQADGYSILHLGKYHGQFQFIGRLEQPLVQLDSMEEIGRYAATHDKVALITYEKQATPVNKEEVYFEQPFRSRRLVMWNKQGIRQVVKMHNTAPAPPAPS